MVTVLFSKIGLWPTAGLKILYVALGLKSLPTTAMRGSHLGCINLKMSKCILPSSFNNFFSKLHCVHDHATRQQVSGNYHHKRVRTDYGKKCCNVLVLLHGVAFLIILKCYHYICFPIE